MTGAKDKVTEATYRIRLFGAFALFRADGSVVDITSRKAIGLLALLSTSEDLRHERSWIMSILWGSRELEQAQSSLRQELLRLRKLLNTDAEVLHVTRTQVWLDPALVEVLPSEAGKQFLEGLTIRGEAAFDDWLGQRRNQSRVMPAARADWSAPVPAPRLDRVSVSIDLDPLNEHHALPDFALRMLQSTLARGLDEFGGVRVIDGAFDVADVVLKLKVVMYGGRTAVVGVLRKTSDMQILFSVERYLTTESGRTQEVTEEINVLASELVERTLASVVKHAAEFAADGHIALRHAQDAINTHFSRSIGAAEIADEHLAQAIDLAEDSAFYAWRAYNMTLFLEDGSRENVQDIRDQALMYAERALELDPYNGLTRALLAHVSAFVFRDFERAGASLERAIALRPDHIMTQDASALLRVYTGQLDGARAAAFRTEKLGRHLPYRYCFATTQSMIETLSGNFSAAVRHGERAMSMMPLGDKLLYSPTLRYLAIAYAKTNRYEQAVRHFDKLARTEGEVLSSDLDIEKYPMPSKDAANLMRESLIAIGK